MESKIQEILTKTNLDWNVSKQRLVTETGISVDEKVALVRSDNNKILSVMGDNYQVYQNEKLCELLFQITKSTGLNVHTGGSLADGRKVFIQLKSDSLSLGDDRIDGFITAVNSHDGSSSMGFGNSNVTISCQNSFFLALKDIESKVRHTLTMEYKIENILRQIDSLLFDEQKTFKEIERLNNVKMTPELEDMVIRTLFQLSSIDKLDTLSTRKTNQIQSFKLDLAGELAQKNDSLWGLLSGVTKNTTHTMYKNEEKSKLGKLFGKTGELERKIYRDLVSAAR